MAVESSDDARGDGVVPVILDGEQEHEDGLTSEVRQKLDGLAKARKIRPWNSTRRFSDDMSVLEEHREDENGNATKDDQSKSRLEELFSSSKNDDGKQTSRATFKPIKLAVAKARYVDEDKDTVAIPRASRYRETTLTLPEADAEGVAAASTDVLNTDNNDDDDAASYIEFPEGPSPTITRTSSGSTAVSQPESENTVLQWLQKPFGKSNNSPNSTTSPTLAADESQNTLSAAGPSTINTTTTTKWKRHSKKGSKVSSQGDLQELPEAVDYAEIDTTKPRAPKRSDTLRDMLPNRSNSYDQKRNNSLRLPIPFRGRRKGRKAKGRMMEDDSSSEEDIDDEEIFQETLRRAGLFDKDVPEQVITEALWQNERGYVEEDPILCSSFACADSSLDTYQTTSAWLAIWEECPLTRRSWILDRPAWEVSKSDICRHTIFVFG